MRVKRENEFIACLSSFSLQAMIVAQNEVTGQRSGADEHFRPAQLTHFDFGLSDWDQEGLLRYKRKFATEEKTISFLRYAPDGASADHSRRLGSVFSQLTDLFTDETVPDHVTEKAGAVLYQYFC